MWQLIGGCDVTRFDKAQEMVVALMEYVKVSGVFVSAEPRCSAMTGNRSHSLMPTDDQTSAACGCAEAERNAAKRKRCRRDRMQSHGRKLTGSGLTDSDPGATTCRARSSARKSHGSIRSRRVSTRHKNDNGDVCQVHEVYAEEYLLNWLDMGI